MAAMELRTGGESDLGSVLMGSSSTSSIFHRRIEFHPSRKAFNGFVSSSGDFKIETLNPGVYDCGRMDSGNVSPLVCGNGRKSDLELLDAWFDPELSFSASFQRIKFVFRSYMEKIKRVHAFLDPEFKDERGHEIERTETSSKESIRDMINDHLDTPMQIDPENANRVWWNNEGAGLENLGNTCFLNSVLQCLTYTEPLAAYLQSGKHQNSCRINGFCALCAIQKHVSRALKANGRILAPKDLVSNLRCISRNFRNARQEDAHEYMVNLLESMHKCCLPSGVPSESPGAYDKSLVYKIFGGRLRSQVKCMQCSYGSNKFDPFIDLSLEIVKADSIVKALKHFTTSELLDGGERQYQCQRCSQKVRALKQLTVHKAPYVLTVHLKRFESHDPGQKINKNVQFDIVLDLKPFVTGSHEGELKYTLYGVLVHHGWSTHSGHYYCYVRTSTNMWYSLDDNHVRQVSESTVLQQKAYMLFYVRNRRNVAPRKFVDISTNVGANKMSLVPAQSPRGPVQLGYKLANVLSPAAGATVKNTSKSSSPFKLNVSGAPVQDSLVAQKEHSTRTPMLKDLINGSGPNQNLQNQPQLGSIASHKVENALVNVRSSGTNPSSGNANSSEELVGSYTVLHACALALEITASKKIDDETSQKMISPSTLAPLAGNSSICSSMEMPENVVAIKVGDQSSINSAQVGSIASEHVSDAPLTKEGEITKKRLTTDKREEYTLLNGPLQKEAADFRPLEKIKRSLKCHVASLHLSTSILFHGSVGPRRMHRKHKSRKSKSRDRKLMESNCFPSDMEPSASGIKNSGTVSSTDSKRKRAKSSSFKEVSDPSSKQTINSNHNSFDIMDEPRGSTSQNVAVLAACVPFEKIGCSSSNEKLDQTAGYELLNDNKRDSMQKGLMSMLTRGLEETLVAHWDGMDISPSPSFESDCTENTSIGYVLDEWDEEYDRGKRKKVRHSKHDFDGPNHFQEFASEKMKLKNSKIDKSCRYPPFRI